MIKNAILSLVGLFIDKIIEAVILYFENKADEKKIDKLITKLEQCKTKECRVEATDDLSDLTR